MFLDKDNVEKFIPKCIRSKRWGINNYTQDSTKTIPGSRHYIHTEDVAMQFYFNKNAFQRIDVGRVKCQKFNIVGSEELNNLELSKIISEVQQKELKYEMVDYHSSRPGHDLRYGYQVKR